MLKLFALRIICRPAGWDNMKKISILHENLQSMKANDYYRDVIAQPATNRKVCFVLLLSILNTYNFSAYDANVLAEYFIYYY